MAAVSEYLLMNCEFVNTVKHAGSFMRLLTTATWRSLYTWDKIKNTNKRRRTKGKRQFQNKLIKSVPAALKTFICQERAKHVRYFAINVATEEHRDKIVKYNPIQWMGKVRKMFTLATGEASNKHLVVSNWIH